MNENTFVINIGRQLGSGGKQIGLLLAEKFGIKCYDKEILGRAAKESGLSTDSFLKKDEHKESYRSFFSNLIPFIGSGDIYGNPISEEALFKFQSETIRGIAEEQSCIFIGRCADYILRNKVRCANIFISADMNDRIKRLCNRHQISEAEAKKLIAHGDNHRASYYNFYSEGTWGTADTYHLCINSSVLGLEGTADYLSEFICKKLDIRL